MTLRVLAPDLYDVDWGTVNKIEVLRGPSASLYGGGGAAGVINISTNDGGPKSIGGELNQTIGLKWFHKIIDTIRRSRQDIDYRMSYSKNKMGMDIATIRLSGVINYMRKSISNLAKNCLYSDYITYRLFSTESGRIKYRTI